MRGQTDLTVWFRQKISLILIVSQSVPTCTVHPGVARPPSPLMIIHNDTEDGEDDDDDNDEDDDDEDDEPSVPLEQYRAWLGEF